MVHSNSNDQFVSVKLAAMLSIISSAVTILGYSLKDIMPTWLAAAMLVVLIIASVVAFAHLMILVIYGIIRRRRARQTIIPPTPVVAPPPPFPGHDYTEDIIDGIRWRWRWQELLDSEPDPAYLHAYCPGPDCDYELSHSETGFPRQRETKLTCPNCHAVWNRVMSWTDYLLKIANIIQRNRRSGGRGSDGYIRGR